MKSILVDIDTQIDFMLPEGSLYVKGAEKLTPELKKLFEFLEEKRNFKIFSSVDTHKKNDPEFKDFPPHCIEGERGWQKIEETILPQHIFIPLHKKVEVKGEIKEKRQYIFKKNKFSIFSNINLESFLEIFEIKEVFIMGVATEYCVRASALDFLKRNLKTHIITDLIKEVDKVEGEKALKEMEEKGAILIKRKDFFKRFKI